MDRTVEMYIEYMRDQLLRLKEGKFTGKIEFQINLKDGGIANLNDHLHRSIKLTPKGG